MPARAISTPSPATTSSRSARVTTAVSKTPSSSRSGWRKRRPDPRGISMNRSQKLSIPVTSLLWSLGALAKPPASPEFLNSGKVYPAGVPLAEAVRIDNTLLLSGQIGIQPGTLKLVPGGIKEETKQTMENIKTTLEAHGYSMRDLVKCTVMLADVAKWGEFNDIYKTYFTDRFPARSALGVNGLAIGAQVEVECIAYKAK